MPITSVQKFGWMLAPDRVSKKVSLAWCPAQLLHPGPWLAFPEQAHRSKGLREHTRKRGVFTSVVRQPHQATDNPHGDQARHAFLTDSARLRRNTPSMPSSPRGLAHRLLGKHLTTAFSF